MSTEGKGLAIMLQRQLKRLKINLDFCYNSYCASMLYSQYNAQAGGGREREGRRDGTRLGHTRSPGVVNIH